MAAGIGNVIIQSMDADEFYRILETVDEDKARKELAALGYDGKVWYNIIEAHFMDIALRESQPVIADASAGMDVRPLPAPRTADDDDAFYLSPVAPGETGTRQRAPSQVFRRLRPVSSSEDEDD